MPEGPTIILLREQVARFEGQKILAATGNAKIDMARLAGQKLLAFRSWGTHFLIELADVAVRVHFLMFGSYTIDSRKDREPRLRLGFSRPLVVQLPPSLTFEPRVARNFFALLRAMHDGAVVT